MKQIHVHRRMGMAKGPDPIDGVGIAIGVVLFLLFCIWAAG